MTEGGPDGQLSRLRAMNGIMMTGNHFFSLPQNKNPFKNGYNKTFYSLLRKTNSFGNNVVATFQTRIQGFRISLVVDKQK